MGSNTQILSRDSKTKKTKWLTRLTDWKAQNTRKTPKTRNTLKIKRLKGGNVLLCEFGFSSQWIFSLSASCNYYVFFFLVSNRIKIAKIPPNPKKSKTVCQNTLPYLLQKYSKSQGRFFPLCLRKFTIENLPFIFIIVELVHFFKKYV